MELWLKDVPWHHAPKYWPISPVGHRWVWTFPFCAKRKKKRIKFSMDFFIKRLCQTKIMYSLELLFNQKIYDELVDFFDQSLLCKVWGLLFRARLAAVTTHIADCDFSTFVKFDIFTTIGEYSIPKSKFNRNKRNRCFLKKENLKILKTTEINRHLKKFNREKKTQSV